jgi:type I restriction enzyme S subunit
VDNVIYRPDKSIFDYRYVVYTLNNHYYTEHANLIARGTTMHRISRTTLGGLSIPVPPLAEQQAIADWLDEQCGKINRVIEKQRKHIELLEEYKQSIITEVVTGKRKVC